MNTSQKLQPHFYFGEAVDRYLESEGAIAQAVDRDTIVLSSSVFALPKTERRTIILHELAHVQQLARGGNDPVSALEDEAWEAAEAWSAGKPFEIRGRARTPLNATAIIYGDVHGKNASAWYTSNPVEPIGAGSNISVKSTVVIPTSDKSKATFEDFLDKIIEKKDNEVVIVCHGSDDQLSLPLFTGSPLGTILPTIVRLAADHQTVRDGLKTPVIPDDDVFYGDNKDQAKRLRDKMKLIRGMKLEHVAFRACNLGAKTESLDAFRDFFGAKSVSAPKLLDSYGSVGPTLGSDVAGWVKDHKKKLYRCWSYDGKVAFALKSDRHATVPAYQILCRAKDRSALVDWMRAHVSNVLAGDNKFVYHGMVDVKVSDKDAPILYFVREQAFLSNLVNYAG